MPRSAHRRAAKSRRAERLRPVQLHTFSFDYPETDGFCLAATVLVRGRMGQLAAIGPAYDQARALGHGPPFCTGINTVPAPRPMPAMDALARKLTAFPTFVALLAAAAGYRPSIRLDLLGRDGLALARAYDRTQAAWGDPRRAFVTGCVRRQAATRSPCSAEA